MSGDVLRRLYQVRPVLLRDHVVVHAARRRGGRESLMRPHPSRSASSGPRGRAKKRWGRTWGRQHLTPDLYLLRHAVYASPHAAQRISHTDSLVPKFCEEVLTTST